MMAEATAAATVSKHHPAQPASCSSVDFSRWQRCQTPSAGISWSKALGLSLLIHLVSPVAIGVGLLLLLILFSLFHIPWENWFRHAPPATIEFTYVKDTHAAAPPVLKRWGAFNQQAGQRKVEKEKAEKEKADKQFNKQSRMQTVKPSVAIRPHPVKQDIPQEQLAVKEPLEAPPSPVASGSSDDLKKADELKKGESPQNEPQVSETEKNKKGNEEGKAPNPGLAVTQTALAPYFKDLNEKFRQNWHPPRGDSSEKVVVQFEVGKDGHLIQTSIYQTSGRKELDDAALATVQNSAPFLPLPDTYPQESISLLFSFDYTILGSKSRIH